MNKQDKLLITCGIIIITLSLLTRNNIIAILIFFVMIIWFLVRMQKESFKCIVKKPFNLIQEVKMRCPVSIDDNPLAQNRMRTWKSEIPSYLYNADLEPEFIKYCFGNLKRFHQWNF